MGRLDLGGPAGITLDRCMAHGLWLDRGELDRLRQLARTEEVARLVDTQRAAARLQRRIPFGDDRWWVERRLPEADDPAKTATGFLELLLRLLMRSLG